MENLNYSNPSHPVFNVRVPKVKNANSSFFYNFYVTDEGTNDNPKEVQDAQQVPSLLQTTINNINPNTAGFTLRIPRYVTISWDAVPDGPNQNDLKIGANGLPQLSSLDPQTIQKIVTEDQFVSSKYLSYSFSCLNKIKDANSIINSNANGLGFGYSQTAIIDKYTQDLIGKLSNSGDSNINQQNLANQISEFVSSVEKMGDNSVSNLGLKFFDTNGTEIINTSGLDQALAKEVVLENQISGLVIPDIFDASGLIQSQIDSLNNYYNQSKSNSLSINAATIDDTNANISPVYSSPDTINLNPPIDHGNFISRISIGGYIVEKYEVSSDGNNIKKIRDFYFNNKSINSFVDVNVKYGAQYIYSIRTFAIVEVPAYIQSDSAIRRVTYYVSSRAVSTAIYCFESLPPPAPFEIDFTWDYKNSVLNLIWQTPPNPQRDIKQFQIFRRSSTDEPFELLKQQCFDKSTKKFLTGETIDGNSQTMSSQDSKFVEFQDHCTMRYIDTDFIADINSFETSKYIYTVVSIDAHGLISNYGTQIEVYFDFFKNKLIKKYVSRSGAPRAYPNMYLEKDLFKDLIQVEGENSKKLKIYFMPDYFNVNYPKSNQQNLMVGTIQNNSFYKIQFINTQNQKSDVLRINIDDPNTLVNKQIAQNTPVDKQIVFY
jgi:hypothetical protein